jgi:hypothetical protein
MGKIRILDNDCGGTSVIAEHGANLDDLPSRCREVLNSRHLMLFEEPSVKLIELASHTQLAALRAWFTAMADDDSIELEFHTIRWMPAMPESEVYVVFRCGRHRFTTR